MNSFVHGIYDALTLQTVLDLGIKRIGFDLRGKSANLIPFGHLLQLLKKLSTEEVYLIFEDDKEATVLSFLNLLKDESFHFILEFRDQRPLAYYESIGRPFIWMFHPDSDWPSILMSPHIRGVLLPIKWQAIYQKESLLWEIIEQKKMNVFLHASTFQESEPFVQGKVQLSVDLTHEVESGFRKVDQERLKRMKLWRKHNENFAGQ